METAGQERRDDPGLPTSVQVGWYSAAAGAAVCVGHATSEEEAVRLLTRLLGGGLPPVPVKTVTAREAVALEVRCYDGNHPMWDMDT